MVGFGTAGEATLCLTFCCMADMYEGYLSHHTHVFGERTKLAMCVTLFNEEEEELRRTMEGIAQNVAQLQVEQDEVVVCLVADGRVNVTESLIEYADRCVR